MEFKPDFSRPFSGAHWEVRDKREASISMKAHVASIRGENYARESCVCCGKAVRLDRPYKRIRVVDGGGAWGLASEKDRTDGSYADGADMGYFAIGSDCLKKVRAVCPGADVEEWGPEKGP